MKEVLKMMKTGKILGPDDILIADLKYLEDVAIVRLTKLFNSIF
jgi:hypothetical protein